MNAFHRFPYLAPHGSVSVGHGPGAGGNDGTAKDRGTPAPDSNLTEIDATQEGKTVQAAGKGGSARKAGEEKTLLPGTKGGPAQPR